MGTVNTTKDADGGACINCKYWRREVNYHTKELENWGLCELQKKRENPGMWTACGENTIETEIYFGCVQFERRTQ